FHRRAVARGRWALRSLGHHPRLRQGGSSARRLGGTLHPRVVARAAPRRHLGRRDRQGHGARRARGELRGSVGTRGRPHGRHRAAGAGDGAPLSADRGHPGARRPGEGDREHHRLRRRDLPAPGAQWRAHRYVRTPRHRLVAGEDAGRLLDAAAARGLRAAGAVMGANFGLENALWFAPQGVAPTETPTYRRSEAFPVVRAECQAVRRTVGLYETTNYGKYEVAGRGARAWLDRVFASRIPRPGRFALAPMLNPAGRIMGDLSIACLAQDRFLIVGSGFAEDFHLRWFWASEPPAGVSVRSAAST